MNQEIETAKTTLDILKNVAPILAAVGIPLITLFWSMRTKVEDPNKNSTK